MSEQRGEHGAEKDTPRRSWVGIRCDHETCAPYGICLVGPPLPTPPQARVTPPDSSLTPPVEGRSDERGRHE